MSTSGRKPIPPKQRARILERDGYRCQRCGRGPKSDPPVSLAIDHIIPVARGGENLDWNLQALCDSCNSSKATKEPNAHDLAPRDPRVAFMAGEAKQAPEQPAPAIVGLYCHKSAPKGAEISRFGWNWQYAGRVHSVIGDRALVQLYSPIDLAPTCLTPFSLAELMGGEWTFYPDGDSWEEAGAQAMRSYWRQKNAESPHAHVRLERSEGA